MVIVMHCPRRILAPKIMAGGTQLVGRSRRCQVPGKTARWNPSR
jgi:hypothetical protein